MIWLIPAFLLTAFLYASVGFGGGSTYTALLAMSGGDYRLIPIVSLVCNLVVVTGGVFAYVRAGVMDWRRLLPLTFVSAPFAWAGGLMPIKEAAFMAVLGISLVVSGLVLLFQSSPDAGSTTIARRPRLFDYAAGAATGFLAGIVGIGGGIFLAPLLHLTRWGSAKSIAAAASLFILVNSLAGLAGQLMKSGSLSVIETGAAMYWPLILAVLMGGQIGSRAGIRLFSAKALRRGTAVLILYVAINILWKLV